MSNGWKIPRQGGELLTSQGARQSTGAATEMQGPWPTNYGLSEEELKFLRSSEQGLQDRAAAGPPNPNNPYSPPYPAPQRPDTGLNVGQGEEMLGDQGSTYVNDAMQPQGGGEPWEQPRQRPSEAFPFNQAWRDKAGSPWAAGAQAVGDFFSDAWKGIKEKGPRQALEDSPWGALSDRDPSRNLTEEGLEGAWDWGKKFVDKLNIPTKEQLTNPYNMRGPIRDMILAKEKQAAMDKTMAGGIKKGPQPDLMPDQLGYQVGRSSIGSPVNEALGRDTTGAEWDTFQQSQDRRGPEGQQEILRQNELSRGYMDEAMGGPQDISTGDKARVQLDQAGKMITGAPMAAADLAHKGIKGGLGYGRDLMNTLIYGKGSDKDFLKQGMGALDKAQYSTRKALFGTREGAAPQGQGGTEGEWKNLPGKGGTKPSNFKSEFAAARKSKKKEFEWPPGSGKMFNTRLASSGKGKGKTEPDSLNAPRWWEKSSTGKGNW